MALSSGSIFFLCGTNDIHANDAGGSKSPMRHNIKYSTISRHLVLSFSFALLAHFNAISFVFFYVLTFRFALYTRQHFSLRFATNTHRKSCNPIYCNRMNWKSATFFPTNNLSFNEKNGTISHELKRPNLLIISKLKCSAFQFASGYSSFFVARHQSFDVFQLIYSPPENCGYYIKLDFYFVETTPLVAAVAATISSAPQNSSNQNIRTYFSTVKNELKASHYSMTGVSFEF